MAMPSPLEKFIRKRQKFLLYRAAREPADVISPKLDHVPLLLKVYFQQVLNCNFRKKNVEYWEKKKTKWCV